MSPGWPILRGTKSASSCLEGRQDVDQEGGICFSQFVNFDIFPTFEAKVLDERVIEIFQVGGWAFDRLLGVFQNVGERVLQLGQLHRAQRGQCDQESRQG